jgi:polysaccharide export outer membrane protein
MRNSLILLVLTATILYSAPDDTSKSSYKLGAGDQILVQVVELPEFGNHPYRVDPDGTVGLPLLGRVRAEGLSLAQFESELTTGLKRQVIEPHLTATLAEPRSQPVSVMGAVNNPGTQQLVGRKTLFDILASAGGPKPDAGNLVTVTRLTSEGSLPLPNAVEDPTTRRITATVRLRDIVDLRDPSSNIVVQPHDEISVPRGQLLYVIGNVKKPGGFTFSEGRSMSALEALSMAEGLAPNASAKSARILRKTGTDGTSRDQIPIDLKKILDGKLEDVQLSADDILFVPDNVSRRVTTKTLETALSTISGIAIWRGF